MRVNYLNAKFINVKGVLYLLPCKTDPNNMNKIYLAILLLMIGIACQPTTKTYPSQLQITWGVKTNFYEGKANFLAELKITNNSKVALENNWQLYFNYSPGRAIDTTRFAKEYTIRHINGDLYCLKPSAHFQALAKGKIVTIPIIASAWAIKESDAPAGFYFIFDQNQSKLVKPQFLIGAFTSSNQLNRTNADHVPVPTAASIYAQNQRLSLLPKSELIPITPTPQTFERREGFFELNNKTNINYTDGLLEEAKLLQSHIQKLAAITLKVTVKTDQNSPGIWLKKDKNIAQAEGYQLEVSKNQITIVASNNVGIFYGIQSLKALLPIIPMGPTSQIPRVTVSDYPRFAYRGMHVDVARNFQSKQSILKLLDIMGFYKLNKLHFHLTDDEGWRLAIDGLPELTEVGAKRVHTTDESNGLIHQLGSASSGTGNGYYSKADFIEILKFAKARHIEVIPEIDLPGHARAAIVAMKARRQKYLAQKNLAKANEYRLHDPKDRSTYMSVQRFNDNVICPCQPSSYRFIEKVVSEIVQMYKEADAPLTTIHTGGDEVPQGVWEKSPLCQGLMTNEDKGVVDIQGLKSYFLNKVIRILADKGLKMAGWEEIGLKHEKSNNLTDKEEKKVINQQLANKNLLPYVWNSVYGWGGEETGYKLANAGYKVVLSNVTHLYFDLAYNKHPNEPGFYWGGFVNDESPYQFQPLNIYRNLVTDLNGDAIPIDKLANKVRLTDAGKQNIRGIQGQLWSETVKTPQRFEYMLLPRLISLAERAWSAQPGWVKNETLYNQAWNEFANRLGQRELPRLTLLFGQVNYHVPPPGAIIKNNTLYANVGLPGVQIRYTTNGKKPSFHYPLYTKPVLVKGINKVILQTFSLGGSSSTQTIVNK